MTEVEILDAMIERLQDKGWVQGVLWEEYLLPSDSSFRVKGKACLQGTAELCSAGSLSLRSLIADYLAAAIAALFPERREGEAHWDTVVKFNDHEDTTFEDVMLVVKTAREAA